MRNYIFTKRERRIVEAFLDGKIPITDRGLSQLRTRIKSSGLAKDVDLFTRLREAVSAVSA